MEPKTIDDTGEYRKPFGFGDFLISFRKLMEHPEYIIKTPHKEKGDGDSAKPNAGKINMPKKCSQEKRRKQRDAFVVYASFTQEFTGHEIQTKHRENPKYRRHYPQCPWLVAKYPQRQTLDIYE